MSMQHPALIARNQREHHQKMQEGTILSYTTITHPPAGFPQRPRTVGLIELDDGSKVLGELLSAISHQPLAISIGQRVLPRKRLSHVTEQGLRVYAICYESIACPEHSRRANKLISQQAIKPFPGYILALTGPSGVGKTTVSKLLATKIGSRAAPVPIITTRDSKEHDEDEYIHMETKEFLMRRKRGEIVAATRIPSRSEQRWYGYRASDIQKIWKQGKVPVVITEMGLLTGLASHFGRRSILSFGLLPPGKSKRTMLSCLLHRLRDRGRDTEASIADRMKNAERDLQFFSEHKDLFDHMIVNEDINAVLHVLKGHVLELKKS